MLLFIWNVCLRYAPNEWFQVWFFKNFLGRGSPSPLPRPLPPFFLGLRPRFGLRPQFSGASRLRLGRFAPSIRAPPSTFGRRTWFGPPKINCWIRHWNEALQDRLHADCNGGSVAERIERGKEGGRGEGRMDVPEDWSYRLNDKRSTVFQLTESALKLTLNGMANTFKPV